MKTVELKAPDTTNLSYLEKLADPCFLVDSQRIILWANTAFHKAFQVEAEEEIMGKMPCASVCNLHLCETKGCPVDQANRSKKPVLTETVHRKGQTLRYYQSAAHPLLDGSGQTLVIMTDISRSKQQESRLRQLETNLSTIPTPIMEIDDNFTITYINPAGAAVVGLTATEAVGRHCFDLFKTPHCKTEKCACNRAMQNDAVITEQTIARPRDGVIIPIKYTGAPIKDAKGNIIGAIEYVLDMTEEVQQQRLANEKIENLNTIPTPIMAMDTEFTITYINPAGAGVVGLRPDEVLGRKCYDLFKTPHCRTAKCACAQAMQVDGVVTEQTIARPRDGVIIPIKYTASPIKDAKGNIKGVLEYVLDITEEARQQQLANEKIENLNAIPTPIFSIDTDFSLTYINPAGAQVLGANVDELIGKKCYQLFNTTDCNTEHCACNQAMRTNRVVSAKTKACIGGRDLWLAYTGAPIKDAKGNIKGALEFALDISAEVEVEQLVSRASQEVAALVLQSQQQMEQVRSNMQTMHQALDQEVGSLATSDTTIRQMVASSAEMLGVSETVNTLAGTMSREAENGRKAGIEAGDTMQQINRSMQQNNEMVTTLVSQVEKIGGFVDIIKEIASQTNLLAFNAAIEAARAGDAGRGFAVVADEVRKLAEKSSRSAVDIANIVKMVEGDSRQTITAMQEGMRMLDQGSKVISTALTAMEEISSGIITISGSVDDVRGRAATLADHGHKVMEQIQGVVASANANQNTTDLVQHSVDDTVKALEHLMASSSSLQTAVNDMCR